MRSKRLFAKKAQFYIFTAVILIAVAFLLIRPTIVLGKPTDAFIDIKTNFFEEGSRAVNNALKEGANVTREFDLFASEFSDYARTKGMDIEFFYILVDDETIWFSNQLDSQVEILDLGTTIPAGSKIAVERESYSEFNIQAVNPDFSSNIYKFNIYREDYQLKLILRITKEGDTHIFLKE